MEYGQPSSSAWTPFDSAVSMSLTGPSVLDSLVASLNAPQQSSAPVPTPKLASCGHNHNVNHNRNHPESECLDAQTQSQPREDLRLPRNQRVYGRACARCKRDHKACDYGRPCGRCVSLGATEVCEDVKMRPLGRPKKRARPEGDGKNAQHKQNPTIKRTRATKTSKSPNIEQTEDEEHEPQNQDEVVTAPKRKRTTRKRPEGKDSVLASLPLPLTTPSPVQPFSPPQPVPQLFELLQQQQHQQQQSFQMQQPQQHQLQQQQQQQPQRQLRKKASGKIEGKLGGVLSTILSEVRDLAAVTVELRKQNDVLRMQVDSPLDEASSSSSFVNTNSSNNTQSSEFCPPAGDGTTPSIVSTDSASVHTISSAKPLRISRLSTTFPESLLDQRMNRTPEFKAVVDRPLSMATSPVHSSLQVPFSALSAPVNAHSDFPFVIDNPLKPFFVMRPTYDPYASPQSVTCPKVPCVRLKRVVASEQASRLFEYSHEELTGESSTNLELMSIEHKGRLVELGKYLFRRHNAPVSPVIQIDPVFITKSGTYLTTMTRLQMFYNEEGFPSFMVMCVDEVTMITPPHLKHLIPVRVPSACLVESKEVEPCIQSWRAISDYPNVPIPPILEQLPTFMSPNVSVPQSFYTTRQQLQQQQQQQQSPASIPLTSSPMSSSPLPSSSPQIPVFGAARSSPSTSSSCDYSSLSDSESLSSSDDVPADYSHLRPAVYDAPKIITAGGGGFSVNNSGQTDVTFQYTAYGSNSSGNMLTPPSSPVSTLMASSTAFSSPASPLSNSYYATLSLGLSSNGVLSLSSGISSAALFPPLTGTTTTGPTASTALTVTAHPSSQPPASLTSLSASLAPPSLPSLSASYNAFITSGINTEAAATDPASYYALDVSESDLFSLASSEDLRQQDQQFLSTQAILTAAAVALVPSLSLSNSGSTPNRQSLNLRRSTARWMN
eukprot:TRINITY_DN2431_c0_g1_i2.p1 TRINITY_DN2431_c0_g1~~TRINITY_DN2431_c0_g1_i2.p1  ORF type:complete len:947 (-),score=179.54 TRINITY_DN2431_c0_g1_i2:125-2965(-)